MGYCNKCDSHHKELLHTAYDEFICVDCWDDYITTDHGLLEYMIGICNGDYPASDFDADFLGEVALSWKRHFHKVALPPHTVAAITINAHLKGLL